MAGETHLKLRNPTKLLLLKPWQSLLLSHAILVETMQML
ncbi:hypothetical protein PNK_1857 [Candidatus Protochlamydia naegleriophila]|uniref:Uncharacterized protein n=1 Tax=Candidatus Protochlamydia naegleriophila TaxID=389348 RepID=A0A0U5JE85_9BACT|nr:hypothetical protein PNK_1857 [Candidatus Protochlamydia naegleriophila]